MITYEPLFTVLKDRNISLRQLERDLKMSSRITNGFKHGRSSSLKTIEKLCLYLDVPIERVVKILPDK